MPSLPRLAALMILALPLAGCDLLGIESVSAVAAKREAEGKAIGAGCRHSARSVEDCYEANKRADKAAVFAGWKEMNDYMRENQIESAPRVAEAPDKADETDEAEPAGKGAAAKGASKLASQSPAKGDPGKN